MPRLDAVTCGISVRNIGFHAAVHFQGAFEPGRDAGGERKLGFRARADGDEDHVGLAGERIVALDPQLLSNLGD